MARAAAPDGKGVAAQVIAGGDLAWKSKAKNFSAKRSTLYRWRRHPSPTMMHSPIQFVTTYRPASAERP
jgi:hypothetical protein